jgi:hypothetical protein
MKKLIYGFIVGLFAALSVAVLSQGSDINSRFASFIVSDITATAAEVNTIADGITATAAEINSVADVSASVVTLTASTTITQATHAGKTILLGEVGGNAALAATLPEATGSGARYYFIISVANTAEYEIQVATNDIFDGSIAHVDGNLQTTANVTYDYTAATSDTINMDSDTTTGGDVGDWIEIIDIATGVYHIRGVLRSDGDPCGTVWSADQS